MIEIKALNIVPEEYDSQPCIFLAGSIEMGVAENWQTRIANDLKDEDVILLNPRRDDWDSSWVQSMSDPKFSEQVNWELDHINAADIIIFYFDPTTKSPITLMELGYIIGQSADHYGSYGYGTENIIVCCPDGFWRKGNVEIMCSRHNVTLVSNYEDLVSATKLAI